MKNFLSLKWLYNGEKAQRRLSVGTAYNVEKGQARVCPPRDLEIYKNFSKSQMALQGGKSADRGFFPCRHVSSSDRLYKGEQGQPRLFVGTAAIDGNGQVRVSPPRDLKMLTNFSKSQMALQGRKGPTTILCGRAHRSRESADRSFFPCRATYSPDRLYRGERGRSRVSPL